MINPDPTRWTMALTMLLAYGGVCWHTWRSRRVAVRPEDASDWLVLHASQTGTGAWLAQRTGETLANGGISARVASMDDIGETELRAASRILFIASTYGEGDAPDSAARFSRMLAGATFELGQLHYGVLALGDSTYANFCAFGRRLDAALAARGARALFPRVDADRVNPGAIDAWQHRLGKLAGATPDSNPSNWNAPDFGAWRIAERRHLNPGSAGAPVFHITLRPSDGALPVWQAGDLVQVSAPSDPTSAREFSIASLPADGAIELVVRLHLHADGGSGVASGWLCTEASETDTVALRLHAHPRFHASDNATRPMILIGNGTGIAGLRAHLKERVSNGRNVNWLLFGERSAEHDNLFGDEISMWRRSGGIEALDLTYSRDGAARRYVQHALADSASELRAWVARGAAIYVCGSLQGMAAGVHNVLVAALG